MEVEVRVVRARVWLSSSLFLHQDGILSLTRVGEIEHVAHATLRSVEGKDGDQCSVADVTQQGLQKCYRIVTMAWEEQGTTFGTQCPRFSLPDVLVAPGKSDLQGRTKKKAKQRAMLPRLDFQLFLLRPRSSGHMSAHSRQQTVYIGASGWQLSEKDVEALVSSREVVFLTTLQDDIGTLEVKLRCVNAKESNKSEAANEADVTGFQINWSSSEALKKDMAEKAQLKVEADKKLIAQLKQTASKAAKFIESRDFLLVHLHHSRAASRIQRRFRLLQRQKQEIIIKLRQEEEARIAAKKALVRDKVILRNHERAFAMRVRLLRHIDNNRFFSKNANPEDPLFRQETQRIVEHMEAERAKLKEKLTILEMQRQKLAASYNKATRSNQHSPKQRTHKLIDDELIRAVQQLHFTRSYSNQCSHLNKM
ncbi:hypothetical protein PHMEG_00018961 [Phytophthora megakarya]|uniref:Uncharacterized protein n=1 Tax=Phytophthora megakarya TaxID=4795 RepID=A0A225VUL1_9STRA|nr:hypothetical protein PHMEG_00018961 [Phytophthora megakarya]